MSGDAVFGVWLEKERVQVGETIAGKVTFTHPLHEKLGKVQAVTIELRARVHGSGDAESVVGAKGVLHQGPVTQLELPFRLQVPASGPVSFQGRYVKIDWEVVAELDIPWAIDPKQVRSIVVEPRRAG